MKRSMFAAAAAAVLVAGSAFAQSMRTPTLYDTRGFTLGFQLNGNALTNDPSDVVKESGAGGGLSLGYGVSDRATLFLRGNVAYEMAQADLGMRYRLGSPGSALRPYAEVAVSRVGTMTGGAAFAEPGDNFVGRLRVSGPAITAGAGVEYFFTRSLALDAGVSYSRGRFTHGSLGGHDVKIDRENFSTRRLNIGFTWRP